MTSFTQEQLEAERAAKSPDELIEMAKGEGVGLTTEQAERFIKTSSGELTEDELVNVSGGGSNGSDSWETQAYADGRTILVHFKCAYVQCRQYESMYARTTDEQGFHDVKCYACAGLHPHVWADGTVG